MSPRPGGTRISSAALAILVMLPMSGCAVVAPVREWVQPVREWVQPVADALPRQPKPWEKGNLARPEMTMAGDALDLRYTQHIYQSKEAAAGGTGVGGGGCGCN